METNINLVNQDTFKQIYYSDEMRNKYIIKFDCNQMPPDLSNYTLLDFAKAEKIRFGSGDEIRLDCYTHGVIIESEDENFQTNIGGRNYVIAKGKKYIPKFPALYKYNDLLIKITKNLKIYINNKNSEKINFLNSITKRMNMVCNNLMILKKNSSLKNLNGLLLQTGNIGITSENSIVNIDENKFYYDYKEHNKDKNPHTIDLHIFLFDDLIQSNFIRICVNNFTQ